MRAFPRVIILTIFATVAALPINSTTSRRSLETPQAPRGGPNSIVVDQAQRHNYDEDGWVVHHLQTTDLDRHNCSLNRLGSSGCTSSRTSTGTHDQPADPDSTTRRLDGDGLSIGENDYLGSRQGHSPASSAESTNRPSAAKPPADRPGPSKRPRTGPHPASSSPSPPTSSSEKTWSFRLSKTSSSYSTSSESTSSGSSLRSTSSSHQSHSQPSTRYTPSGMTNWQPSSSGSKTSSSHSKPPPEKESPKAKDKPTPPRLPATPTTKSPSFSPVRKFSPFRPLQSVPSSRPGKAMSLPEVNSNDRAPKQQFPEKHTRGYKAYTKVLEVADGIQKKYGSRISSKKPKKRSLSLPGEGPDEKLPKSTENLSKNSSPSRPERASGFYDGLISEPLGTHDSAFEAKSTKPSTTKETAWLHPVDDAMFPKEPSTVAESRRSSHMGIRKLHNGSIAEPAQSKLPVEASCCTPDDQEEVEEEMLSDHRLFLEKRYVSSQSSRVEGSPRDPHSPSSPTPQRTPSPHLSLSTGRAPATVHGVHSSPPPSPGVDSRDPRDSKRQFPPKPSRLADFRKALHKINQGQIRKPPLNIAGRLIRLKLRNNVESEGELDHEEVAMEPRLSHHRLFPDEQPGHQPPEGQQQTASSEHHSNASPPRTPSIVDSPSRAPRERLFPKRPSRLGDFRQALHKINEGSIRKQPYRLISRPVKLARVGPREESETDLDEEESVVESRLSHHLLFPDEKPGHRPPGGQQQAAVSDRESHHTFSPPPSPGVSSAPDRAPRERIFPKKPSRLGGFQEALHKIKDGGIRKPSKNVGRLVNSLTLHPRDDLEGDTDNEESKLESRLSHHRLFPDEQPGYGQHLNPAPDANSSNRDPSHRPGRSPSSSPSVDRAEAQPRPSKPWPGAKRPSRLKDFRQALHQVTKTIKKPTFGKFKSIYNQKQARDLMDDEPPSGLEGDISIQRREHNNHQDTVEDEILHNSVIDGHMARPATSAIPKQGIESHNISHATGLAPPEHQTLALKPSETNVLGSPHDIAQSVGEHLSRTTSDIDSADLAEVIHHSTEESLEQQVPSATPHELSKPAYDRTGLGGKPASNHFEDEHTLPLSTQLLTNVATNTKNSWHEVSPGSLPSSGGSSNVLDTITDLHSPGLEDPSTASPATAAPTPGGGGAKHLRDEVVDHTLSARVMTRPERAMFKVLKKSYRLEDPLHSVGKKIEKNRSKVSLSFRTPPPGGKLTWLSKSQQMYPAKPWQSYRANIVKIRTAPKTWAKKLVKQPKADQADILHRSIVSRDTAIGTEGESSLLLARVKTPSDVDILREGKRIARIETPLHTVNKKIEKTRSNISLSFRTLPPEKKLTWMSKTQQMHPAKPWQSYRASVEKLRQAPKKWLNGLVREPKPEPSPLREPKAEPSSSGFRAKPGPSAPKKLRDGPAIPRQRRLAQVKNEPSESRQPKAGPTAPRQSNNASGSGTKNTRRDSSEVFTEEEPSTWRSKAHQTHPVKKWQIYRTFAEEFRQGRETDKITPPSGLEHLAIDWSLVPFRQDANDVIADQEPPTLLARVKVPPKFAEAKVAKKAEKFSSPLHAVNKTIQKNPKSKIDVVLSDPPRRKAVLTIPPKKQEYPRVPFKSFRASLDRLRQTRAIKAKDPTLNLIKSLEKTKLRKRSLGQGSLDERLSLQVHPDSVSNRDDGDASIYQNSHLPYVTKHPGLGASDLFETTPESSQIADVPKLERRVAGSSWKTLIKTAYSDTAKERPLHQVQSKTIAKQKGSSAIPSLGLPAQNRKDLPSAKLTTPAKSFQGFRKGIETVRSNQAKVARKDYKWGLANAKKDLAQKLQLFKRSIESQVIDDGEKERRLPSFSLSERQEDEPTSTSSDSSVTSTLLSRGSGTLWRTFMKSSLKDATMQRPLHEVRDKKISKQKGSSAIPSLGIPEEHLKSLPTAKVQIPAKSFQGFRKGVETVRSNQASVARKDHKWAIANAKKDLAQRLQLFKRDSPSSLADDIFSNEEYFESEEDVVGGRVAVSKPPKLSFSNTHLGVTKKIEHYRGLPAHIMDGAPSKMYPRKPFQSFRASVTNIKDTVRNKKNAPVFTKVFPPASKKPGLETIPER